MTSTLRQHDHARLRDHQRPLPDPAKIKPRRNYATWRALSLSLVYVAFAAHVAHWKITGKTLAPLELNEVMYTLELGIVTAGFLFMCVLVLGTLIFGRFFCSWACHILVLQDLCAWILTKFRIRAKPIRSRLLLLVPPLTALYMFVWPQIKRMWYSGALPEFHLATDADGWASLATSNFWRNLPGPAVTAFTFLICGFAIVYLLGSRTFCTYVCPYGAVFGLADRLAPGRIRVTDACTQCGTCTAVCTSGIRVHEEVKQHGMIVNSSCLKDLNCVAACPSDALQYRFGKPSLLRSQSSGGRFGSVPYDFSVPEELLISTVFLVILLTFRGLYGHVPFLLSLALGIIAGALAVAAVRLWTKPEVIFARVWLKQRGKLTRNGKAFLAMAAFLVALVGHSSFIRYHEYSGLRAMALVDPSTPRHQVDQLHHVAWTHLQTADNWGLIRNPRAERQLMSAAFHLQHFDEAADLAERVVARNPDDLAIRLTLGQALLKTNQVLAAERTFEAIVERTRFLPKEHQAVCASAHHALGEILAQRGKFAAASNHLAEGVRLDPDNATLLAALGSLLAEIGEWRGALDGLTRAVELDPSLGRAHYNLGAIYARLGRFEEAVACYKKALAGEPEDVDVLNNLGFSLLRVGRAADACTYLQRALAIQPDSAAAHFNFGSALIALQRVQEGTAHLLRAVALDARYAKPLRNEQGN